MAQSTISVRHSARRAPAATAQAARLGILLAASAFAVASLIEMGLWALSIPVYLATGLLALTSPRATAIACAGALIAVEPNTFDFTRPASLLLYNGPPEVARMLPLTISPVEVALLAAGLGMIVKAPQRTTGRSLPRLVAAVPLVVAFGLAYGLYRGGAPNLAYHEARGLLFAMAAFIVAPRATPWFRTVALRVFLAATVILALTTILRYLTYVRFGSLPVPPEFAFAHDSVIYMSMAMGLSAVMLMRGASGRDRLLFSALMVISLVAVFMTGRRSATLVAVVCVASLLVFTLPRRPHLVSILTIGLTIVGVGYLAVYWNTEYGTFAQPARAVRSQIDPSPRDESSDAYRTTEKFDAIQTIRDNRLFGVGFGNPFGLYQPLPDLTSFWPLQYHTPHQNVLWLWLKMGIAGLAVFVGLFALALSRCLNVLRFRPHMDGEWQTAAIVATSLLMYLTFATVDIIFPSNRGMIILGVLFALAFSLPRSRPGQPGDKDAS